MNLQMHLFKWAVKSLVHFKEIFNYYYYYYLYYFLETSRNVKNPLKRQHYNIKQLFEENVFQQHAYMFLKHETFEKVCFSKMKNFYQHIFIYLYVLSNKEVNITSRNKRTTSGPVSCTKTLINKSNHCSILYNIMGFIDYI